VTNERGQPRNSLEPYQFIEIVPRAWACISNPGAGSIGNAGFVELDGRTIVFDTSATLAAASAIRAAAEQVAPIVCAIISHWHGDHSFGASVFEDVPIVSTFATRALIDERARAILDRFRAMDRTAYFETLEERAQAAEDPSTAESLRAEASDLRLLEAELDRKEVTLPNVCFGRELILHGSHARLELRSFGGGHTASDAVLLAALDGQRVVFAGDLVVTKHHPSIDGGNLRDWSATYSWIEDQDPHFVVGGHGAVGGLADIGLLREYFEALARGGPEIPEQFKDWGFRDSYAANLEALQSA
jgi:cyclase